MRVWRTIGDWTAKNTQECGKNDTIFACVIFFVYLCSRKDETKQTKLPFNTYYHEKNLYISGIDSNQCDELGGKHYR